MLSLSIQTEKLTAEFCIILTRTLYSENTENISLKCSSITKDNDGSDIEINIETFTGNKNFTVYTMDFTKKYIEINADYRSWYIEKSTYVISYYLWLNINFYVKIVI